MHPLPPALGGGNIFRKVFARGDQKFLFGWRGLYCWREEICWGGHEILEKKKKLHNTSIKTISGIAILI